MASTTASHLAYVDATVNPVGLFDIMADQYSQYFNEAYPIPPARGRTLSQQEQFELMETLEQSLPDVSAQLVRDSETFYQS